VALAVRGRLAGAVIAAAAGVAMVQGFHWGWAIPARDRVAELGTMYGPVAAAMTDREAPVLACDLEAVAEAVYYLDRPVEKLAAEPGYRPGLSEALAADRRPRYLIISAGAFRRAGGLLAGRSRVLLQDIRRKRKSYLLLALDGVAPAGQGASPDRGSVQPQPQPQPQTKPAAVF
jgi:hypothetical protein